MDTPILPHGLWPSPVTPDLLAGQRRLEDVQWDPEGGALVWLERRSGRGVLVARTDEDAPRDLTPEHSVRAEVGYGGGDFCVRGGRVVYVSEGRLYARGVGPGPARAITPACGQVASPAISPDGGRVLFVHSYEKIDSLALAGTDGQAWPVRLAAGADFYMQPAWHPDGRRIAWIEWDHPGMPWDGTRLRLGRLNPDSTALTEIHTLAGGPDTPVFQPAFSPDGRHLAYLAGDGEWDSLYVLDLENGQARVLVEGGALMQPAWTQGMHLFGWSEGGRSIVFFRGERGFGSLWRVRLDGGAPERIETGPYQHFEHVTTVPGDDRLAFAGSAPAIPDRVVSLRGGRLRIEARSAAESIPAEDLPAPQPIEWAAPDGTPVHGLYYPPTSRVARGEGLPPAIINIHGGPTSQRVANFNAEAAFFATRGYAWLEVNYRGSTGYGRAYMKMLQQKWGLLDVEDAVGGAQALVERGLADGRRLVVKGGSAGGYTVLNCLIRHPGFFRAGVDLYGVAHLIDFNIGTHKFEERYNDSLVGVLPRDAERFRAWSPALHADRIRDPLAIFQGADDRVVPRAHSDAIAAVLKKNGVPHLYRVYEGEGHGWRRAETIRAYYEELEGFLKQYVLF